MRSRGEEPSADALVTEASSTPAPVATVVAPVVVSVPPSRPAPTLASTAPAASAAETTDVDPAPAGAAAAASKAADEEVPIELTPAPATPEPAAAEHPPVAPILLTKVKDEPSVAAPEITYPLPPPRREDLSGTPTAPVAPRVQSSRPPPARVAASESSRPPSSRPAAFEDEGTFAPRRPQLRDNVAVPVSSIVIAGAAVIAIAITGFLVGRSSSLGAGRSRAQRGVAAAFLPKRGASGASSANSAPRPCFVAKQATMWADRASKSIPFELFASSAQALSVGYARDENEAVGLEVDAASGATKETFTKRLEAPVERVMPNPGGGFTVATTTDGAPLKSVVEGASTPPFFVGVAGGGLARSSSPDAAGTPLWPLDDADINAARIESGGPAGFGLTFRKGKQVVGGWIGPDKHPVGGLVTVAGSGGDVGKPMSGYNGIDFAVTFADRPTGSEHWQIRAGRAPAGAIPATTSVIPLPKGGPGGDAFAPDVAGLPDGRWLLVWTEGPPGKKAMRAQTLSRDFELIGDPIAPLAARRKLRAGRARRRRQPHGGRLLVQGLGELRALGSGALVRLMFSSKPRAATPRSRVAVALGVAALVSLGSAGCLHSSSHVERGEPFSTGVQKYDDFFKEVIALQNAAKHADDEEIEGRADLVAALGLAPKTDLSVAVGETRGRAQKMKAYGVLMHLELTPDVKLVTTRGKTADEFPPALAQGISESTRKSLDLARRLDEAAAHAQDLEKTRVKLRTDAPDAFRALTQVQRDEIVHELDTSADVLVGVEDEAKKHAGRASEFVVGVVTAVETGAAGAAALYATPPPPPAVAVASARATPPRKAPAKFTPKLSTNPAPAKPPPTAAPATKKKPKGGDDFEP